MNIINSSMVRLVGIALLILFIGGLPPAGVGMAQTIAPEKVANGAPILLKYGAFRPAVSEPEIPREFRAAANNTVRLVQVTGPLTSDEVDSLEQAGAVILGYVPEFTYLADVSDAALDRVRELPVVNWVGQYHAAFKIQPGLLQSGESLLEVNVLYFNELGGESRLAGLKADARAIGAAITAEESDYPIIRMRLPASAIAALASRPEVRWIDRWDPPVALMDKIRNFTGATAVQLDGFDGTGIVGQVKDDGIDQGHPDFGNLIGTYGGPVVNSHGTSTFGIVFSDGAASSSALGMMPAGQGVFCDWYVNRTGSISNLVNSWGGVFQSNSWHQGNTDGDYSSYAQQNDAAVNTYDVSMLYAAGNYGTGPVTISQDAAAKNVITVGAVFHKNTETLDDDEWQNFGYGSTPSQGPARDGRIKPDIIGVFDSIYTTDVVGGGGYSPGNYTTSFGGTSGATPIVAGATGLVYQMFRENHFGGNPGGEMPGAATVKAMLIANARQYDLSRATRFQQGWGLVDVGRINQAGSNQLIVDGGNPLQTGQSWSRAVNRFSAGEPLKVTLVWNDKQGETSSSKALINDLDLTVTAPDGTVFSGNRGLVDNLWSSPGQTPDRLNNVENVFIQAPLAGVYTISVTAYNIAQDNDGAPGVNQDFSLVAAMVNVGGPEGPSIVTGPGAGLSNPPLVRVFDATSPAGALVEWPAYGANQYGVNVSVGDLDGDGTDEIVTGAGPGAVFGPHVRGWSGAGVPVPGVNYLAYGTNKYGVNVASGDIDGDGIDEIITGAGPGAIFGPHVRGWNVDGGSPRSISGVNFFAYGTLKFGVNVAAGDLDGDGTDEIVTGAGPGAVFGPHVRGWSYSGGRTTALASVNFLAYGTPKFGVNVASGDIDNDGLDEIITGAGPGVFFGPQVRAWNYDGEVLSSMAGVNFFAYDGTRFGVVVGTADLDGDGADEILTAPGPDASRPAWIRGWNVDGGAATLINNVDFDAYGDQGLTYGAHVAGGNF